MVVILVLAFGLVMLALFARKQLHAREPMLDLSLFSRPAIAAGMIIAIVASGALAGVELTLAQELQYVLGKTPFQAGVFMVPIMAAAAVGGPVAGYLSNLFGLRLVASLSLLVSAIALGFLAVSDFHDPGLIVPVSLAVLGLMLSIGLTASSIAIMGSVEASKGGAAGSLEATSYELGTGLGISLFGVFMSAAYRRAIAIPEELALDEAEQAVRSIGDTYLVAQRLGVARAATLIDAGKVAFSTTHSVLLSTAAGLIRVLAVLVFFMLASYRENGAVRH